MSDAPRGRGRGRGKRISAHTLAGTTVAAQHPDAPSASPSPAPDPSTASASRASSSSAMTPAPEQTEDAPMDTDDAPALSTGAKAAPQRRASVKRVASVGVGSSRAPSVGMSRTPSAGGVAAPLRERPVGGLLGSTSEFRPGASGSGSAAGGAGGKPKFKPNMRRKERVVESDDEDVKMEDGDSYRKRGPRAPMRRQEVQMTASGPMAQGPGGPPKTWGQRPTGGNSGAAVMAASRDGTLGRMLDADSDASDLEVDADPLDDASAVRLKAIDLNDIGLAAGGAAGDEGMPPLTLPRDPKVLKTKIRRLQERKQERLKKEARDKAKAEGVVLVKPEPTDDLLPSSVGGTPLGTPGPSTLGGFDSKEGSLALTAGTGGDEDKEAKDLKDLEEEEKKEIILSEAFDLAPEARGELYMFQFPRKFPHFIPASPSSSSADPASTSDAATSIKPDPDAPSSSGAAGGGGRQVAPPPWGRFGSRQEKAARWSAHEGRIGTLCVHRSGKVTLKLEGDLRYEVLPAAQPSFLQEIAVIDPQGATVSSNGNGKSRHSSASSSSDSASSSESDASSSSSVGGKEKKKPKAKKAAKKKKKARALPPDSLVVLGQTAKKFLVVPDIADLLDAVATQERDEKDAERRVKMERAKGAAGVGGVKREGTAAPRR
ncbi:hypothetical protein Rhopal_003229-T1 [Rhodotorula paludigena]|uniref:Uncharacterized protein n=1 Tax=Rhodotorula paludigena TaxID=86838 RepID=A0AAV5GCF3_9BASI|nr:hypothetical protein Rhopal_003229-T1 [Rhodotorula paludigena]